MHVFDTLNTLVPEHYILRQLIQWNTNINGNVQPLDCETAKNLVPYFSCILANLLLNFCNNHDNDD